MPKPILKKTAFGWKVTDGLCSGNATTIEMAYKSYLDCRKESESFGAASKWHIKLKFICLKKLKNNKLNGRSSAWPRAIWL